MRSKENKSKAHFKRKPVLGASIPSKSSEPHYQLITESITPEPATKVCKVIFPILPPLASTTTVVPAYYHQAKVPSSSSSSSSPVSSVASSLISNRPVLSVHPEPAELVQFHEIDLDLEYSAKQLDAPIYKPTCTSKEHIRSKAYTWFRNSKFT